MEVYSITDELLPDDSSNAPDNQLEASGAPYNQLEASGAPDNQLEASGAPDNQLEASGAPDNQLKASGAPDNQLEASGAPDELFVGQMTTAQNERQEAHEISTQDDIIRIQQQSSHTADTLVDEFPGNFQGFGKLPWTNVIHKASHCAVPSASSMHLPKDMVPKLKKELWWLWNNDFICEGTDQPEWINKTCIITKPDDTVRIRLDTRDLNKAIVCEPLQTFSAASLAEWLRAKEAKFFTLLEVSKPFLHLELDEDSSKLCTFETPFGYYRFKRMPQGISCAPAIFQRAIERSFQDIDTLVLFKGSLLICGKNISDHDDKLQKTMNAAQQNNIRFKKKMQVGVTQIKYLGHIIGSSGVKLDSNMTSAVLDMPRPDSKEDLERFISMAKCLGINDPQFCKEMSSIVWQLRMPNNEASEVDDAWMWSDSTNQKVYDNLKLRLVTPPVLQSFDESKQLTVQIYASSCGLGAVAFQDDHPLAYASATLPQEETDCSKTEKILRAAIFGCEQFKYYAFGQQIVLLTNHKPLVWLVNSNYENLSPKVLKLFLRLQNFDVSLQLRHRNAIEPARVLSLCSDTSKIVHIDDVPDANIMQYLFFHTNSFEFGSIRHATAKDIQLVRVTGFIHTGWPPEKARLPPKLQQFWDCQNELHVASGLVCRGRRLVIPSFLRREILSDLHNTIHIDGFSFNYRARMLFFWPSISSDIRHFIENSQCQFCQQLQQNTLEPIMPIPEVIPEPPPSANREDQIMRFWGRQDDNIRVLEDYVLSYNSRIRGAWWVLEHLTAEKLSNRFSFNLCDFKDDEAIHPYFRPTNDDYKHSSFDRGHLAAAANHCCTQTSYDQTFLFTNALPQVGKGFNQGIWNKLETYARKLTSSYKNIYICTGPLFLPEKEDDGKRYVKYEVIGNNNVAVPTHYFKVIVSETYRSELDLESYLLPNAAIGDKVELNLYLDSLESIERNAGFRIFKLIPHVHFRRVNKCKQNLY